jgi:hypothetical protein
MTEPKAAWQRWLVLIGAAAGIALAVYMAQGDSMSLTNEKTRNRAFLQAMYDDDYFPDPLVDKGKQILIRLCERIENEQPADETALYELTHAATNEFNELAEEFHEADSELETAARESIGEEFYFIAKAYGYDQADAEELIATRDW